LNIREVLICTDKVFSLLLAKVSTVLKNHYFKMTSKTFRRSCHMEPGPKAEEQGTITKTIFGYSFRDINGRDKIQWDHFRNHLDATGLADFIDWIIAVVLSELQNPGENLIFEEIDESGEINKRVEYQASEATKQVIKEKQLAENEKRALRIEIDGTEALNKEVDEPLNYTTSTVTTTITTKNNRTITKTITSPIIRIPATTAPDDIVKPQQKPVIELGFKVGTLNNSPLVVDTEPQTTAMDVVAGLHTPTCYPAAIEAMMQPPVNSPFINSSRNGMNYQALSFSSHMVPLN
jgi:hypothetical protein